MIRKTTDKSRGVRLGNFVQIRTIVDEEMEDSVVWQEECERGARRGLSRPKRTVGAVRVSEEELYTIRLAAIAAAGACLRGRFYLRRDFANSTNPADVNGRPSKNPCASLHPQSVTNHSCSCVSTPSATTCNPSPRARLVSAATILQSAGSLGPARTNWPSILITSTGKRRRLETLEYPVPNYPARSLHPSHATRTTLLRFGAVTHQTRLCDLDL